MLSDTPDAVVRYFQLDADRDVDGVTALFTDDGVVVDERETHHGREAIRAWRAGPASRYTYTTEILGTERSRDDRHIVTARLTGDFPGATVVLRHDFTLAGHRIARLVIAP
jgi:hypothetical protein